MVKVGESQKTKKNENREVFLHFTEIVGNVQYASLA